MPLGKLGALLLLGYLTYVLSWALGTAVGSV